MVFVRLFKTATAAAGGMGTPMFNDRALVENNMEGIREAMKANYISSVDVLFLSEIPESLRVELQVYLAEITVIFNPDKTGDQFSSAKFAAFLSGLFPADRDIKCVSYENFTKNFAAAFKRENKAPEQILSLLEETLRQIKDNPTMMGDEGRKTPSR